MWFPTHRNRVEDRKIINVCVNFQVLTTSHLPLQQRTNSFDMFPPFPIWLLDTKILYGEEEILLK